jgi:hypothetical protein
MLIYRKQYGGEEAYNRVSFKKDQAVINICKTWAGAYDSSEVETYGFERDDEKTGYGDAVQDFQEWLAAQKK